MAGVQIAKEQAEPLTRDTSTISTDEDGGHELANTAAERHNRNFPYFLSVLQHLRVDILDVTWQPALEDLGRGKYTLVAQSLINNETSFAFKRWDATSMYADIVSEITILSIPAIREHANINPLLGVCWEVVIPGASDSAGPPFIPAVRPVLVTPKSPYGNLRAYLARQDRVTLDLNHLLHIYIEIAHAINTLHMCNVVHGDIKPDNVLVFDDEFGGRTTKIIDFAYSARWTRASDFIRIPSTKPWSAPEWHLRGHTFDGAKKMDVYSYGLLCLWLLCKSGAVTFHPSTRIGQRLFGQQSQWVLADVEEFKSNQDNIELLDQALSSVISENSELLSIFRALFRETLQKDPRNRPCNLTGCMKLLMTPEEYLVLVNGTPATKMEAPPPPSHVDLDLTDYRLLVQLTIADFEVRAALAESLHSLRTSGSVNEQCQICSKCCSAQITILNSIGLACLVNQMPEVRGQEHEILPSDLESIIQKVKKSKFGDMPIYNSTRYKHLQSQGYILQKDLSFRSSLSPVSTDQLQHEMVREMEKVSETIGETHDIAIILQHKAALFLESRGRYEQALTLLYNVLSVRMEKLGPSHHDTLASANDLARTLKDMGRYNEAAQLIENTLSLERQLLGEQHMSTLMAIVALAQCRSRQGRLAEAADLLGGVAKSIEMSFGKYHPFTCAALGSLAFAFRDLGQWNKAAQLERDILNRQIYSMGNLHEATVVAKMNLATTLNYQGLNGEAEHLQNEVVSQWFELVGEEHPYTNTARGDLACTYLNEGRLIDAESTINAAIKASSSHWDENHPQMLRLMSTLSSIKFDLGHQTEAVELAKMVYNKMLAIHGETHADSMMILSDLAALYARLRNYKEAELLMVHAVELKVTHLGPLHPETIQTKADLAWVLMQQSRLEEAVPLYRQLLTEAEKALGQSHPDTRTIRIGYASVLIKSGNREAGMQIWKDGSDDPGHSSESTHPNMASALTLDVSAEKGVLEARRVTLGSTHPLTLEAMNQLATTYILQERFAEAEKLTQEEVTVRRQDDQTPNREFLKLLQRLAMLKANQGSYEGAKNLLLEVHNNMSLLGDKDPETIRTKILIDEITKRIVESGITEAG